MNEKREPLTLEQLREMLESSEIVGAAVTVLDHGVECCGVLDNDIHEGICVATGASGNYLKEKDYGKRWVAYAYKPAQVDRSAWEPCEFCGEWIGGECTPKEQDAGYTLYAGYSKQVAVDDFWEDEIEDVQYCPKCGRPLTEEAWKELEQRLER